MTLLRESHYGDFSLYFLASMPEGFKLARHHPAPLPSYPPLRPPLSPPSHTPISPPAAARRSPSTRRATTRRST